MEKIPVAIVGLGRIAGLLEDDPLREKPCTHAGAVAGNKDCLLIAGADIDGERRSRFAERWKVPVYDDAAVMLKTHRPRILHIATHPDSHEYYCRLAAVHAVPVVVCEKPLADTLRRARRIAALENSRPSPGLRIITNHERRYSGDYIRAKDLLGGGTLGALLSVKAVLYMGRTRRLVDILWHDGTHLVDAIMFLTGAVMRHRRTWGAGLGGRAGTAYLSGRLEGGKAGGRPFTIELGAERDHLVFELEFSCERGRLRIGNGIFEVWESGPSPYAEGFKSLRKTEEGFGGATGYFANMQADAVACLREPSRKPRSCAADGLRVIEYLHSVRPWGRPVLRG
jgi:predicted dehydrogenase